jgi:hypothetical protein
LTDQRRGRLGRCRTQLIQEPPALLGNLVLPARIDPRRPHGLGPMLDGRALELLSGRVVGCAIRLPAAQIAPCLVILIPGGIPRQPRRL